MNGMLLSLLWMICVPEPQFIPVPQFVPIPAFNSPCPGGVCPVEVAPAKRTERTWGITGWTQGRCPSCPATPQYGWIESEVETVAEAASKLQGWRALPDDEVKRLAEIVDAPAVAKAIRQEYDIASCGMVCTAHGSRLYDVFEDGSVALAKEQGESGGYSSGGGWYPGKWIGKIGGRR